MGSPLLSSSIALLTISKCMSDLADKFKGQYLSGGVLTCPVEAFDVLTKQLIDLTESIGNGSQSLDNTETPLDCFSGSLGPDSLIGRGGFATVHKVKHKLDQHAYALKEIEFLAQPSSSDSTSSNSEEATFEEACKEIQIMKSLDHSNIVSYIDSFLLNKLLYIRMELCNNSLAQILQGQRKNIQAYSGIYKRKIADATPQSSVTKMIKNKSNYQPNPKFLFLDHIPWEGMNIIPQLLSAMQYLQEKKIVHRDIKPENILMKGQTVKLSDFGLAKCVPEEQDISALGTYEIGTPNYIPPELAQKSMEQNPYKWDIYSLGVVYLEMALNIFCFEEMETGWRERDIFFKEIIREKPDWILGRLSKWLPKSKNCDSILIFKRMPQKDILAEKLVPNQKTIQTLHNMLKINPKERLSLGMLKGTQDPGYDTVVLEDQTRLKKMLRQVCQREGVTEDKFIMNKPASIQSCTTDACLDYEYYC